MKKFNILQEVWSYLLFCPLCRDMTRDIHVAAGPGEELEVKTFKKVNETLFVKCLVKKPSSNYKIAFHIDCTRNNFVLTIQVPEGKQPPILKNPTRCYLYLLSDCKKCGNSNTNSSDIELDLLQKKISNIGIELEGMYFLTGKSKYHLTLNHTDGQLLVSRCIEDPETGGIIDENKTISFPLSHFDFSKPKKVINRIRTLLVFS